MVASQAPLEHSGPEEHSLKTYLEREVHMRDVTQVSAGASSS